VKTRVNILVEKEIVEKAHELGINVSKACENCLKQYIKALEGVTLPDGGKKTKGSAETVRFSQWTGRDLNPRLPDCESGVHTKLNYRPTSALSLSLE
jgi:post-segregation antitoxin (ccd killing protein)